MVATRWGTKAPVRPPIFAGMLHINMYVQYLHLLYLLTLPGAGVCTPSRHPFYGAAQQRPPSLLFHRARCLRNIAGASPAVVGSESCL